VLVGLPAVDEMAETCHGWRTPRPGADPLSVAAVLLEDIDVVGLDIPGSASRTRAVLAPFRSRHAVLITTTQPRWTRLGLEMRCDVAGFGGLGHGRGRLGR
jgi:hypothetical protein